MDPSQLAAFEARLQRLEDLAEIQQLFVDYGRYLDRGDFAAYAHLFAVDGELDLGATGKATGRDAISATKETSMAPLAGSFVHVVSSPAVELHGDTATSEVMWTAVRLGSNGKPQVTMVGRHLDDLVREDGRWLIRRRRGVLDLPSEHRGSGWDGDLEGLRAGRGG